MKGNGASHACPACGSPGCCYERGVAAGREEVLLDVERLRDRLAAEARRNDQLVIRCALLSAEGTGHVTKPAR